MIAYNVQPLAQQNLTGIGNYANDVLKILLQNQKEYELHVFDFMSRNGAPDIVRDHLNEGLVNSHLKTVKSLPLSVYIRMGKMGKVIPYKNLTGSDSDVTVFFNYLAPEGLKEKSIITIYDMVCERYPETMDDRNRKLLKRHLQKSADNASAIVTISEFSKNEIIELLGVPSEKVFVAHCGVNASFYKPASDAQETAEETAFLKDKWDLDEYVLYVGTLEPRKNTKVLVDAFEKLARNNPHLKLVLAGGIGWHSEETLSRIDSSEFKDRIIKTGYISNEEKRTLLRNARVFVFPSMYEGFGMPVTEAMACGTPCVIANTSSLPEVSLGLAPMVGKDDAEGFANEIEKMLNTELTPEKKQALVSGGASFSWENAAKVYEMATKYALNASKGIGKA